MPVRLNSKIAYVASALVLLGPAQASPPIAPNAAGKLSDPQRELRERTRAHERASRLIRPSPLTEPPASSGILRYPVDTNERNGRFKGESNAVSAQREGLPPPGVAPPPCRYTKNSVSPMKVANRVVTFPEVTWHICITDMGEKGLWIGPVEMRRTPTSTWMPVLYQAGLADIFVAYHNTPSYRFHDLQWTTQLDQVTAQDWGPNGYGTILTNETVPTVVEEMRDRGVGWLCKGDANNIATGYATRRAREYVVWAVSDAGNYDNIVEYTFRDDGSIGFRMGNTGYNSVDHATEAHSHNALWRVDIDLNGGSHNSAFWFTHAEPYPGSAPKLAQDFETPFNVEGARQWNAPQYASLLIEDAATNVYAHHLGYEFVPAETGISRHYDPTDDVWTQNDVYVTEYHPNEADWTSAVSWINSIGALPDQYLLPMLNNEAAANSDLVVWIKSSAHHDPSDEDRSTNDLPPQIPSGRTGIFLPHVTGVTLVHWSGFDMEPHDLFDTNPLGGPVRCGN